MHAFCFYYPIFPVDLNLQQPVSKTYSESQTTIQILKEKNILLKLLLFLLQIIILLSYSYLQSQVTVQMKTLFKWNLLNCQVSVNRKIYRLKMPLITKQLMRTDVTYLDWESLLSISCQRDYIEVQVADGRNIK